MNPSKERKSKSKKHTYNLIKPTGNGAFGMVYKAKDAETGQIVAIKKVFQDKRYRNRELSTLQELNHPNCIILYDYFKSNAADNQEDEYLNLIMDYMPETLSKELHSYSNRKQAMPLLVIKLYAYQLIRSLGYIHSLGICHRDLKPQNVLTNPETHELKLCDFGSAKKLVKGEPNVSYISSRPYRAPELIFGATEYTPAIDIWSAGCVIAELVIGQPIFAGESSLDQIVEIIKVLGTPNKQQIQAMNPEYTEYRFPVIKQQAWSKVFEKYHMPEDFLDLIDKMLLFDPYKRTKPFHLLGHRFFDELRDKNTLLENGNPLPNLFNFNDQELRADQRFIVEHLIPEWYNN